MECACVWAVGVCMEVGRGGACGAVLDTCKRRRNSQSYLFILLTDIKGQKLTGFKLQPNGYVPWFFKG